MERFYSIDIMSISFILKTMTSKNFSGCIFKVDTIERLKVKKTCGGALPYQTNLYDVKHR